MPLVQDPRFALHAEEKRTPLRVLQDVRGPVDQERARTAARTSLSCARRSEGIAHTFSGRRLRYVFSTELACSMPLVRISCCWSCVVSSKLLPLLIKMSSCR